MNEVTPVAFISYSHDSETHKSWVLELAKFLVENGVKVMLDQWNAKLGADLPKFMEDGLSNAQRVLIICTDAYLAKANEGSGGVGYEKRVVTAELLAGQDQRKFIPVVKDVSGQNKLPTFMGASLYIDFSKGCDEDARRHELLRDLHGVPPERPPLGKNPFEKAVVGEDSPSKVKRTSKLPSLNNTDSTALFAERFAQAFPGVRETTWFEKKPDIQMRLAKLLEEPLRFADGIPIWWWRGFSNLHIDHFEILENGHFLLNFEELDICKIAAVHSGSYFRNFVYVEAAAMEPTGLYSTSDERIAESVQRQGYSSEEYGLIGGGRLITRGEYDDGAALIDGQLVDTRNTAALRVRYITPYNFLIAANGSPINNSEFDRRLELLLNGQLSGAVQFDALVDEIRRLPRRERY